LISLGIVAPHKEFYAEFNDFTMDDLSDWDDGVQTPSLSKESWVWLTDYCFNKLLFQYSKNIYYEENCTTFVKDKTENILKLLLLWLEEFEQIEFWADVPPYDWYYFVKCLVAHFICLQI
jgi:hypothetical protein